MLAHGLSSYRRVNLTFALMLLNTVGTFSQILLTYWSWLHCSMPIRLKISEQSLLSCSERQTTQLTLCHV